LEGADEDGHGISATRLWRAILTLTNARRGNVGFFPLVRKRRHHRRCTNCSENKDANEIQEL
jgi:hypothetical protein